MIENRILKVRQISCFIGDLVHRIFKGSHGMVSYFSILKTFVAILPSKMVEVQWTFFQLFSAGKNWSSSSSSLDMQLLFPILVPLLHWKIIQSRSRICKKALFCPPGNSFGTNKSKKYVYNFLNKDGRTSSYASSSSENGKGGGNFWQPQQRNMYCVFSVANFTYLIALSKNEIRKKNE